MTVIHHTFGPHVTGTYTLKSLQYLAQPWKWQTGKEQKELEDALSQWFDGTCGLFSSGRDALLALLRACDFETGSEIIIQGYTCVALPNAIHAAGYTPVFADTDPETLNLTAQTVAEKITHRTKAIICQHTFGMVADTAALRTLADKHNLMLIEDCAHIIPDVSGPDSIGKKADAIMLSFGRDKAVSGIMGGAAIVKNPALIEMFALEKRRSKNVRLLTVGRMLLYPIIYLTARPVYGIGLGKALLWFSAKMGALIPVLTRKEKAGFQSPMLRKIPNPSAGLVRKQLRKFHSFNNHRRVLTNFYLQKAKEDGWKIPKGISEHFPMQKFPIYVKQPDRVRAELKKQNIYLDDGWTGATVCPRTVDQESAGYISGSCPNAEQIEEQILTLPTHPTMTQDQAEMLAQALKPLLG